MVVLGTQRTTYTMPTYLGRNLNGTMSVNMTRDRMIIPPPPTPWMHLPTSKTEMASARAHRMLPMAKSKTEVKRQRGRPRMSLKEAVNGMVTPQVKR
jgi:hypothetical protein